MKSLKNQVFFIIGATVGPGPALVRLAARSGAKVFMVDKSEEDLQNIQDQMSRAGFTTAYAIADVTETDQLEAAADKCISTFHFIDTWINYSGEQQSGDPRLIFENNFWGLVSGSKVATSFLKDGGAIINIESHAFEDSEEFQGLFLASRAAFKAYLRSFKTELKIQRSSLQLIFIQSKKILDVELTAQNILRASQSKENFLNRIKERFGKSSETFTQQ